jgi:glycosyltransferase involved in cell wall biosynthesis
MKILCINNFNYLRGGAETVYFSEMELLEKNGNNVTVFSRKHPQNRPAKFQKYFPSEMVTEGITLSAKGLRSLLGLFYSKESKRCLDLILDNEKVDIAHAHNIYGRLTTSILDSLHQRGIPVVITLHDYKVICPNYKLMHHGRICEDCRCNGFYHAILNRCHKNSIIASTVYAFETYFNYFFNKYQRNVRYFISPSLFLKNKLIEFGWPGGRIEYIPNFISSENFEPKFKPGNYFLYLGRLSVEKGISTLIKAFTDLKNTEIGLKIAGEGPLEGSLKKIAKTDHRISFPGYLTGSALAETTKNAIAVVVPSEWYENAPLSVLEAMAYGKPVIGARIGGIPEMIDNGVNGFLFESGNPETLTQTMSALLEMDAAAIADMGNAARSKIEDEYNSGLHYERLIALYRRAING